MREMRQASVAREEASTLTPERQRSQVEIEQSLDQLSRWMDGLFRIPGTGWRIGLDALIGLVPGVGDFATTAVSFYILAAGVRYRVPKVTLLRMAFNIAIDYVIGAVPVVGDILDVAWKSNQMNVELLRRHSTVGAEQAREGRLGDWLFVGLIMLVLLVLLLGSIGFSLWLLSRLFGALT